MPITLRCENIFTLVSRTWKFWTQIERLAPRPPTHRCVNILAPRTLTTICQRDAVLGTYDFSYLEEWSPFALLNRKIYARRPSCLSNIPGHTVWYRKCSSGVPNELRGKKQHSWFSFTNLGVWYNRLRSKWLLFRVKKGAFDTRKVITNWGRVQKATFFTRWIGPKSSSFPCLLVYCMTTMKIKPLTYKLSHRISTGRNCLNFSTIKQNNI